MTVYRIAKWRSTFETAESRKYKTLTWISIPVGFSSSGYQQLLEEFDDEAPAIYGAWCALCGLAATCNERGTLATSKGVALKISHIARVTGFPIDVFKKLMDWAARPDVGWLEDANTATPGESPGDLPERRENNQATKPNLTEPNITQPDQTEPDDLPWPLDGWQGEFEDSGSELRRTAGELVDRFKKVKNDSFHIQIDVPTKHKVAWVCAALDRTVADEITESLKRTGDGAIKSPTKFINWRMRKLCERFGETWPALGEFVPLKAKPPPLLKSEPVS